MLFVSVQPAANLTRDRELGKLAVVRPVAGLLTNNWLADGR
jgi:hypothetical protein